MLWRVAKGGDLTNEVTPCENAADIDRVGDGYCVAGTRVSGDGDGAVVGCVIELSLHRRGQCQQQQR